MLSSASILLSFNAIHLSPTAFWPPKGNYTRYTFSDSARIRQNKWDVRTCVWQQQFTFNKTAIYSHVKNTKTKHEQNYNLMFYNNNRKNFDKRNSSDRYIYLQDILILYDEIQMKRKPTFPLQWVIDKKMDKIYCSNNPPKRHGLFGIISAMIISKGKHIFKWFMKKKWNCNPAHLTSCDFLDMISLPSVYIEAFGKIC